MEHLSKYFFVVFLAFVLSCSESTKKENTAHEISFEDLFENEGFIDLDSLFEQSRIQQKPILLYFTGFNVVASRHIEQQALNNAGVVDRLSNDFLFAAIFVDDHRALPKNAKIPSCNVMKSRIETIGDANMCLQINLCGLASQPYFLALDPGKKAIGNGTYQDIETASDFMNFLNKIENSFVRKS